MKNIKFDTGIITMFAELDGEKIYMLSLFNQFGHIMYKANIDSVLACTLINKHANIKLVS